MFYKNLCHNEIIKEHEAKKNGKKSILEMSGDK